MQKLGSWDGEPFVWMPGEAWVFGETGQWRRVDDAEVGMEGRVMSSQDFHSKFARLPALPQQAFKGTAQDAFDPGLHPRGGNEENTGQFSKGSGGGGGGKNTQVKEGGEGAHPGKGYSNEAVIKGGKIYTSNVYDATRALYEKRDVVLEQPDQVSTLIDHLGEVARNFARLGSKAPVFDLCKVSVEGTNLFCAESKGIPRIQMPQLADEEQTQQFQHYLANKGYKLESGTELASHLRATQNELNGVKVARVMQKMRTNPKARERRLVISKDNYILDGHHTWGAVVGLDAENHGKATEGLRINVTRVGIDIVTLLKEADTFTEGKGRVGVEATKPPEKRSKDSQLVEDAWDENDWAEKKTS